MKDFYDIWLLSRVFDFEGSKLATAIQLTFDQRGTHLTDEIVAFQATFIAEKQTQWTAFCRRLNQEHLPIEFNDIVTQVKSFLAPLAQAVRTNQAFDKVWQSTGGWV